MVHFSLSALALSAASALAASLEPVADFGANPTGLGMFIYVPDAVAESPAIIVAVSNQPCARTMSRGHVLT